MVLVYFFIFITILSILILFFSVLRIDVQNLEISNEIEDAPIVKECNLCIGIYFLKKVRILKKCIDKNTIETMKKSTDIEKFKSKVFKEDNKKIEIKDGVNIIKLLEPKLQEFKLDLKIGTEDVILTSFLICIISIAISMFLANNVKKYNEHDYKYIVLPNYDNKNSIKIGFSGIVDVKLVNIINTIFKLRGNSKREIIKRKECEEV